jgi:MarR family transcriptional regulator, organic hydroperoxide resistance regulator
VEYEALKLGNQLCFPLWAASRRVVSLYRPVLDPLGLTYTQYIVLLALWERDQVSVKELGERLYLDSGTLTPVLKKLEAQGRVTRQRSTDDERLVIVSLSAEGRALKDVAASVPTQIASCVTLPMEDAAALHRLLHALLADDALGSCAAGAGEE